MLLENEFTYNYLNLGPVNPSSFQSQQTPFILFSRAPPLGV